MWVQVPLAVPRVKKEDEQASANVFAKMIGRFLFSIAGTAIGLTKKVPLSNPPEGSPTRGTEKRKRRAPASLLVRCFSFLILASAATGLT